MTGSLFMQHTPSRFTKVARAAPLQHAHPGFTRFMAANPRLSLFVAEHPKASRFVLNVARHIPVLDHYVPLAPHVGSLFNKTVAASPEPPPPLTRFMARHPKLSRFVAEHVPALCPFLSMPGVATVPHVASEYNARARKPKPPHFAP